MEAAGASRGCSLAEECRPGTLYLHRSISAWAMRHKARCLVSVDGQKRLGNIYLDCFRSNTLQQH